MLVVLCAASALAQGTAADYSRAAEAGRAYADALVFRDRVEPNWLDGARFWYRVRLPEGRKEFVFVDAEAGRRRDAFDHGKLAAALAKAARRPVDRERLPFDAITPDREGKVTGFAAFGKSWRWTADAAHAEGGTLAEAGPAPKADTKSAGPETRPGRGPGGAPGTAGDRSRDRSPDGKWALVLRDNNLHLRSTADGTTVALTTDGTPDNAYSDRGYWSPKSTHVVVFRTRTFETRKVSMVASSPKDQVQPRLITHDYTKPGDPIPQPMPVLFDIAARRAVPVDRTPFENPWANNRLRWEADGSRFTFLHNRRGHQVLRVIAVSAADGKVTTLIEEAPKTFVDYSQKTFLQHLDDTGEILWMSERSGHNHLYLIDAKTGAVKNPVTSGAWQVRGVEHVDTAARRVWFRAVGVRPGQDPYHVHWARVDFDGRNLVVFTEGDGTHAVAFSPDRSHVVDTWSRVDLPPRVEVRRTSDGKQAVALEEADISRLPAGKGAPVRRFTAKGRDGVTDIWGVIFLPVGFDPARRYPVVENIYAGPHGHHVPKSWRPWWGHRGELTELGFIVVQIDGMGTNWRGKAFHDLCWRNIGDAGFPDRIAWIKAAAKELPAMDLSRGVGIYGGSAGGQNALRAVLAHGEFYTAAAADCGCHDNRMDKIWWNEAWMGWPVGPHYADSSNVTHAGKLTGKLLLTVGELDRNVDPASTMQVVDALVKADKDFELIVVPGADHGAGESRYCRRRRQDFFVRALMGVEPRRAAAVTN